MKRWLQFSLASFLAIPLIVAVGLFLYESHVAKAELQDRLAFIDKQVILSKKEVSLYKKIVGNKENRPYFTILELVQNSDAHAFNLLHPFDEIVEHKENLIVVIKCGYGRPDYIIFQIDKSNKICKFVGRTMGDYLFYKIAGDSVIVTCRKIDFNFIGDPFQIVFDCVNE